MKANRSKTYLFPLLSREIGFDIKYFNKIKNVYLRDDNNNHNKAIYIELLKEKNMIFLQLEQLLMRNTLFIGRYEKDNKYIYVFNFPTKFLKEYVLFLESKYSKFGEDAKIYILNFWSPLCKTPNKRIFLKKIKWILYKDKKLKDIIEEKLGVYLEDTAELGEFIKETDEIIKIKENG